MRFSSYPIFSMELVHADGADFNRLTLAASAGFLYSFICFFSPLFFSFFFLGLGFWAVNSPPASLSHSESYSIPACLQTHTSLYSSNWVFVGLVGSKNSISSSRSSSNSTISAVSQPNQVIQSVVACSRSSSGGGRCANDIFPVIYYFMQRYILCSQSVTARYNVY